MSVVVFCGSTVSSAEVRGRIDAICLPPAKHGDILRAVNMTPKPRAIALIDGLFRTVPAVRHKEILWALSQGVHVFGASSMGALRAAELHEFGMVGVGSVFSAYRSGEIEDDDEVAVEHGPAEIGFLQLSDAMVDIRATLAAALHDRVLGHPTAACLLHVAKQLFYARRNWPDLLELARGNGCDASEIATLQAWLPSGRVDLKRRDALELLETVRAFMATDPPPFKPAFTFERTEVWDLDCETANALPQIAGQGGDALLVQDIFDELRLMPRDFACAQRKALSRFLLVREARRHRDDPSPDEQEQVLQSWLREQGMSLQQAIDENRLDEGGLEAFLKEEALARWAASSVDAAARDGMLNALRSQGKLAPLIERAGTKQHALRMMGKENATTQTGHIAAAALIGWFWQQTFPDELQMMSADALAARLGFHDASDMNRALLREYLFSEYCRKHDLPIRSSRLTWE